MIANGDSESLHRQIKARLFSMPPRAFELFAGELLEFIGLSNISVTRYSGDGGIDAVGTLEMGNTLISIPAGVQIKRYRTNVQRPDIDRFIGALSGQYPQGIFITTAGYTRQATLKATNAIPRITTVNGDQIVTLMVRHRLGITEHPGITNGIDEEYFEQFEAQATARPRHTGEQAEQYQIQSDSVVTLTALPEDDLISLRALSHTLRVDSSTIRRLIDQGKLQPETPALHTKTGFFFRRDRIESIRLMMRRTSLPSDPDTWRREFLDFARSRNLSKSYKPVMLKALLTIIDRNGEAALDLLTREFRAFYVARHQAGLPVEYGPPDLSNAQAVSDTRLRQLIIQNPLERFLIKGFLEYQPEGDIVRFAPQLWHELRYWELLEIQRSADEQLVYYYQRLR